ncbi:MAG: FtsX-like permease family protein [Gemmatimonadetes bacterium]|nr:FtsX-like permease family protein [Gemmatimonadota bacterium]
MTARRLFAFAWRESRFARRRLFLFLSAISLGVAALVAVQGFASNMLRGVRLEARALLGADVRLSSREPFGQRTEAFLDSLHASGNPVARMTSFASMAFVPRTGGTRLVQVRAPEAGYPFYGTIETEPAGQWGRFIGGRNAIVDPALLTALRAQVGDSLSIGEARFRIAGTLQKVPGDAQIASAFAPRVYIPSAYLEETELLGFGSRIDYDAFVRLRPATDAELLLEGRQDVFRAERVRSDTAEEEQGEMEEALTRLTDFLGLIGVFALLLGGIGVASAMGAYMAQKVDTVAVLRCLGATSRQVLAIYLAQAAVMGLAGALLGVAIGAAVQWVLPRMLQGLLPVEVAITLEPIAMLTGIGVGVWTALAFAALPLLAVRRVSPLGALRRRVEALAVTGPDPLRGAVWALLAASVLLLLVVQVDSLRLGAQLWAGTGGALAILWVTAWLFMTAVRRIPRDAVRYTTRQGLANLFRPGNQTRTVVVALGFGVFLLATLLLIQHNLLRPLRTEGLATRANLLFFDVQQDQEGGIVSILNARALPVLQRAPIVPMRVVSINGIEIRPFSDDQFEPDSLREGGGEGEGEGGPPRGWAARREYRSTYRDTLVSSETLVEGTWTPQSIARQGAEVFPVSLEQGITEDLGVDVGDRVTWDVQGVQIPTVVAAIREVDWTRFEPNFFAVFPTRALATAPQTWVMLTRADSADERAVVQRDVVERYANVSALDLTQIQVALDEVLGRISLVIRFLAAFSVATGLVVLLGAVSSSRIQRIRESVLLKTIGATRPQIGAILFTEYLLLGLLSVVTGIALALGAGWALSRFLFEVDFEPAPVALLSLAAGITLLAVAIGVWASREVFSRTPLEAIREE